MLRRFFTPIVLAFMLGFAAACSRPLPEPARTLAPTPALPITPPASVPQATVRLTPSDTPPTAVQTSVAILSPSPTLRPTLTPLPTPNLDAAKRLLIAFVEQRQPADFARLTSPYQTIGQIDGADWHTYVVTETASARLPVVIASFTSDPFTRGTLAFTWRERQWQVQELPYLGDAEVVAARQAARAGWIELVLAYKECAGCSATAAEFDLWRWNGAAWDEIWAMSRSADENWKEFPMLHGQISFPDPALNTIHRKFSSWNGHNEKNSIFDESNPGPHRWFEETWVREGDAYRLTETRVQASAYNTLVEFVNALRHGDETAARRWVTDPTLVERAFAVKLEQSHGLTYPPHYSSDPSDPLTVCSIWHIEFCDEWQLGWSSDDRVMHIFIVHLVQRGENWLIDRVDAMPPVTPTPIR